MRRLRSRMGVLRGVARVDGKVVVEGTMTFALGPRNDARRRSLDGAAARDQHAPSRSSTARDAHTAHFASGLK